MTTPRRALVLAGALALAIGLGSPLCRAEPARAADHPAVAANNDFAADLYRELAKENNGKNLFFSPYSMSVALAMTAEGARGETASQMGKVLRFPAALARPGAGASGSPWDMGPLHTDIAALNDRFNARPVPREVRAKIDKLRTELKEANAQVASLEKAKKFREAETAALKAQKLAGELNKLLSTVDQYELKVANALWAEKSYPFQDSYFETIKKYYRTGGAFPVDFRNDAEGARKKINAWVEKQTNDRIKDLIPPRGVDDSTRLVLTNAIYFKGEWAEPFKDKATRDEDFLLADGKKVKVPLMRDTKDGTRYAAFKGDGSFFTTPARVGFGEKEKEENLYPDKRGFLALEVPYKGDDLSMLILLPRSPDGLPALEKMLTSANLRSWEGKLQKRTVNVFLPRFKLETDYKMGPALKALGMVRAFVDPREPNGAQFDGMSVSKDPRQKLYITKVLHKAFVEVNEKGTEAAAATAVIMATPTSAPSTRPFIPTFRADKPFVFLIRDRKSGTILFLGRMLNPKG